jgi:hypothetical protein
VPAAWLLLSSLPDELPCSDREEPGQLGQDALQRAGDDADHGGEQAADNRKTAKKTAKHRTLHFWGDDC